MLKAIKDWLAVRKQERYNTSFERGYGWAMTARFHLKQPIDYIRDQIWRNHREADELQAFDRGAMEAVYFMEKAQERNAELHAQRNRPLAPRKELL